MEIQGTNRDENQRDALRKAGDPAPGVNPERARDTTNDLPNLAEARLPVVPAEKVAQPSPATEPQSKKDEDKNSSKPAKWSPDQYFDPTPSPWLIKTLCVANEWFMLKGLPIIRSIPLLNRLPVIGSGLLKFKEIDIPKEDVEKFRSVVNSKTAAFLSPNHPEFVTDWMIDKEVSRRVSPLMAHWADKAIVNMHPVIQKFWLKNNLVSNVRKGGGKEYSIEWASKGHGVLLHPEGMVPWTGNKVFTIYPGIVDMAVETALKANAANPENARPVYIVPFVSKYRFVSDVSRGLNREMAKIENRLGLSGSTKATTHERFFDLQARILAAQEKRFGTPESERAVPITAANYFDRQDALYKLLNEQIEAKYGAVSSTGHKGIFQREDIVKKAPGIERKEKNEDLARLKEIRRLYEFSRELYGNETLTQEDIAESLKRIKRDLVNATVMEKVSNYIPIAVGRRVAHVRIADPIDVSELLKVNGDTPEFRADLLARTHESMQLRLNRLVAELNPELSKYSRPNPFFSGPAAQLTH